MASKKMSARDRKAFEFLRKEYGHVGPSIMEAFLREMEYEHGGWEGDVLDDRKLCAATTLAGRQQFAEAVRAAIVDYFQSPKGLAAVKKFTNETFNVIQDGQDFFDE